MTSTFSNPQSNTKLTPEERADLIKLLHDSKQEFLALVENLTDQQWGFKPSPDKWSVGETAEHIVLAEGLLIGIIQRALASNPDLDWETRTGGKEETLEKILAARMGQAQAPQSIQPNDHQRTRSEIMSTFKEGRARSIEFAETTDASLKDHTFDNPYPIFGTLNAHQWLLYIPQHTFRHNKQILEVKADPNFPR